MLAYPRLLDALQLEGHNTMRGAEDEGEARTTWQPITLPGDERRQIYFEVVPRGGREEVGILDSIPFEQAISG